MLQIIKFTISWNSLKTEKKNKLKLSIFLFCYQAKYSWILEYSCLLIVFENIFCELLRLSEQIFSLTLFIFCAHRLPGKRSLLHIFRLFASICLFLKLFLIWHCHICMTFSARTLIPAYKDSMPSATATSRCQIIYPFWCIHSKWEKLDDFF